MKKWATKSNLFSLLLLALVVYLQGPIFLKNLGLEGTTLASKQYKLLSHPETLGTVEFPPKQSRAVTIFWASWCGPCKIEMQRLKSSVENKKISPEFIFAINPFETHSEVMTFLKQNHFPFQFIEAPNITEKLNITSTPTTMFLNQGEITSLSSGLSFIGIWKAEYFL